MSTAARDLVWIASYPKSGNTWVRFMLCNLIFGIQETAGALNALAPDVHELGVSGIAGHTGLAKTHFPYSASLPHAGRTAAAIYVVRHPADVLVSNFHYAQRRTGLVEEAQEAFERYFETFLAHRGDPRWTQLGMGTWDEHVRSWLQARLPFRVLAVKYEDLHADPRGCCARMAAFLGLTPSAQAVDAAVAAASFERMRSIEDEDILQRRIGIFYKPYLQPAIDSGLRFMRRGRVGERERMMSAEQGTRLTRVFADLTAALGYDAAASEQRAPSA